MAYQPFYLRSYRRVLYPYQRVDRGGDRQYGLSGNLNKAELDVLYRWKGMSCVFNVAYLCVTGKGLTHCHIE
jgi:hypothetical protein